MKDGDFTKLSKRERQIMDIIYAHKEATAMTVMEELPEPPSYSAVRALLKILEKKGFLTHKKEELKYIYMPVIQTKKAMESAVKGIVKTYFNNSLYDAVCALLKMDKNKITEDDYRRITELINRDKEG